MQGLNYKFLGFALLFFIVVAAMKFGFRLLAARTPAGRWPLYARELLNGREQMLYWRLVKAFPDHIVFAQVSLSQLLGIEKGAHERQALKNRFRQLTADFVICSKSFKPVAVIELDGMSHDHPRRQDADKRKKLAVESAGIPLHRMNTKALLDEADLKQLRVRTIR